jgi:hypothetical protein
LYPVFSNISCIAVRSNLAHASPRGHSSSFCSDEVGSRDIPINSYDSTCLQGLIRISAKANRTAETPTVIMLQMKDLRVRRIRLKKWRKNKNIVKLVECLTNNIADGIMCLINDIANGIEYFINDITNGMECLINDIGISLERSKSR